MTAQRHCERVSERSNLVERCSPRPHQIATAGDGLATTAWCLARFLSSAVPSARPKRATRFVLSALFALLLLWPLAACSPTAYPPLPPEKANRVEAVLRADIDLSKPVLLFFHADGVNDSELMKPIFSRLEAIYGARVSFRLLNVAQPEGKRLWEKVSTKTPTLLLINREKGFVEQHDKYVKEEDLKALIEEMLAP